MESRISHPPAGQANRPDAGSAADHRSASYDQRLHSASHLRDAGLDPYPAQIARTRSNAEVRGLYAGLAAGESSNAEESIVGRVTSVRNSGMFTDIFDGTGKLQLFAPAELAANLPALRQLDLGDFVSATGTVRRTTRGELTVDIREMAIVAKALRAPPDKFHGLRDPELRQRKRYLDLIANEESRSRLLNRSRMLASIRRFLGARDFIEVETPVLQPIYGGASARPFMTHHNTLDLDIYLRVAPELYLKRLLIGGLSDRIYEIGRNFRNEGISTRHNPEFTMLELYMAYADQSDIRTLLEDMIRTAVLDLHGATSFQSSGHELDFAAPFRQVSMIGVAESVVDLPLRDGGDDRELRRRAAQVLGRNVGANGWGEIVEALFEHGIDGELIQPTHVIDFPADISPLAKRSADNPLLADRFETYCLGMEIANAFTEQNDPVAQRAALVAQCEGADLHDGFERQLDEDFLEALEHGMPPAGGLGLGIDRLAMILTDTSSIRDIIAFPVSRPVKQA